MQQQNKQSTEIALLASPHVLPSALYGMQDLFACVNSDWQQSEEDKQDKRALLLRIAARCSQAMVAPHNTIIRPQKTDLSARAFLRRFKAAVGMSPVKYVTNLRINASRKMLESSTEAVEIIAEKRAKQMPALQQKFKSMVGLTPTQYRQKHCQLNAR